MWGNGKGYLISNKERQREKNVGKNVMCVATSEKSFNRQTNILTSFLTIDRFYVRIMIIMLLLNYWFGIYCRIEMNFNLKIITKIVLLFRKVQTHRHNEIVLICQL